MNKVILIGRLTKDPEVTHTKDGKAVAHYTLAVDRRVVKKDDSTDYISCVGWEKKAQFAEQYLRKGTKICITGRIQTGKYTNKDGQTVYTTDVVVEDQEFCEKKAEKQPEGTEKQPEDFVPDIPADLPFV